MLMMKTTMLAKSMKQPPEQSQRWRCVQRRDARADGTFVFAVKTTGVYCRPSCGARAPLQRNVEFFKTPSDAERAGYRACKRCRPNESSRETPAAKAVAAACRLIVASEESPDLTTLAQAVAMSSSHFHRVFKSITGVTPKAYATAHRSQRVRESLSHNGPVTNAIFQAGFNSTGRFYATSSKTLGMKPSTYRAGGAGMTIRFATGTCSLGTILVAATGIGVCFIAMDDDADALQTSLRERFPRAAIAVADDGFKATIDKVIAFVERPSVGIDLPLDVRGTAFQQRVWQALTKIGLGKTKNYAQIASEIGMPDATRAVGAACGANPVALAIPCHRVVRTDGSLSGYRWGLKRKAKLLELERRVR